MGAGSDGKAAGQAPRLDHLLHLNVDDDDNMLASKLVLKTSTNIAKLLTPL